MKTYSITTITSSKGILYLTLSPRSERDIMGFTAGQYASLSFMHSDGSLTPSRSFSIVSSPSDQNLSFAIRIGGRFTKDIARLPVGTIVQVQGPYGVFTLSPRQTRPVVLLAGGIGITPMLSMLRFVAQEKLTTPITLLYSCRSIDDAPFYDELRQIASQNPAISVHFFAGDIPKDQQDRQHISGRINDGHIAQCINRFSDALFYVCGPKGFNKTITDALARNNVPSNMVLIESFASAKYNAFWGDWSAQKFAFVASAMAMAAVTFLFGAADIHHILDKDTSTVKGSQAVKQSDDADENESPVTTNASSSTTSSTNNSSAQSQYQQPVSSVS